MIRNTTFHSPQTMAMDTNHLHITEMCNQCHLQQDKAKKNGLAGQKKHDLGAGDLVLDQEQSP